MALETLERRVPKPVWVVAHRGASGHAPENTLAAFGRAVELGARFIETDLHLTRDARLVAIHDSTLDRTTNGRGPVQMQSLDQVRALDAGSWFGSCGGRSFDGERVPTIGEILQFSKDHDVVFYLEIKSDGAWGVEHALVAALRESGEAARVVILSFDAATLESVHRLAPILMTGYLCERLLPDPVQRALQIGARQLAPRADLVTPSLVEKAHQAGFPVIAWTVNDTDRMRHLIAAGVDGIMSDYPDRLNLVLQGGE